MRYASFFALILVSSACGATSESDGIPRAEGSYTLRSVDFLPIDGQPPVPIPVTWTSDSAPWDSVTLYRGELLLRPDSSARLVIAHKVWTGATWTPSGDSIEGGYTYIGSQYPPDHSYHRLFSVYGAHGESSYFWILRDGRAMVPSVLGNNLVPEYYFSRR